MSARTEFDRLVAARPAVLRRTEDVVDAAGEDRILQQILSSGEDAHAPRGIPPRSRTQQLTRRLSGVPAAVLGLTAAGVIAAVMLAVTAPVPASHQAGRHSGVRPAAWLVAKQPNGTIALTVRELSDAAGLQRTLRADGIPASVTFASHPSACQALQATPQRTGS
jgi:hypothetical protein